MATLTNYLRDHCITEPAFAASIGVTRPTVARYKSGARIPDRETMAKIVEVTGGEVTPNDFFGVTAPVEAAA